MNPRRLERTPDDFERRVVVSGVGQSQIARRLPDTNLALTIDAVLAAVTDAGLSVDDVDGVATIVVPAMSMNTPGEEGPDCGEVIDALGIRATWAISSAGGVHPFVEAIRAVADDTCRHVVVYRTVKNGSASKRTHTDGRGASWGKATGALAWQVPVGAFSTANLVSLSAQRYMHDYGLTREQLGWLAVTQRAHAARNPDAVYREPLSIDDYLAARMISEPFCIYDCDVTIDASTAIVFSRSDAVSGLRSAARIEALGWNVAPRQFEFFDDLRGSRTREAARTLWSRSDLTVADVDAAQLYDGHSWFVLEWLEALGFCAPGSVGNLVEGGTAITYGGTVPVNTWGGQLSAGRLHAGFGHLAEALRQLRGEAGPRQVPDLEVTIVTAGPGSPAMLLTR